MCSWKPAVAAVGEVRLRWSGGDDEVAWSAARPLPACLHHTNERK